jgi:rubrerythrin
MHKPTSIGSNRTGIATSRVDSKELIAAAQAATPFAGPDGESLAAERLAWASAAEPVGTMPPPATLKGAVKMGVKMIQGERPNVFLDKLGERAAYERSGTRLYEALLVKHAAANVHVGGPSRADLERIRDDELRHYGIVRDAIVTLGADPTVMTPCADVSGVMGMGLIQVVTDPRTTLTQCLEAILAAELIDQDAWTTLIRLAEGLGHDELAARFQAALAEEAGHVGRVRGWLLNALEGQAGIDPTPARPAAG